MTGLSEHDEDEILTPEQVGRQFIENPPLPKDLTPLMPTAKDGLRKVFSRPVDKVLPEEE